MALPEVTQEVVDGALGTAPDNIDGVSVKLGVSSLGSPNTLYSFSRPQDVRTNLGEGPLVEAACHHLQVAGGPLLLMPLTAGVAGSNSAVTQSGSGPLPTLTGTPLDAHEAIVKIILGGAVGTATFQVSLDGGDNYSPIITTAASYLIPASGTTVVFTAGTYVAGTTYSWTGTAPYFNTTNLNSGFTALLALPNEWMFAHVVGRGTAAADTAAMAAAVNVHMVAASTNFRYVAAILEAADDTDGNITAALASVSAPHVNVVAGFDEQISAVTGRIQKRPFAWPVAARASKVAQKAQVGIATHLGRVKDLGLPGIVRLYRDEYATPALDAQRITTARTIIGKQGFFITRGRMLAPAGSDFSFWHDRMVVNKACRITRFVMVDELNESVRTNANGTIFEADAQRIETTVTRALEDNMVAVGNVVTARGVVNRSLNVTSTGRVEVDVRFRRRGYLEDIRVTLGFESPSAVAA
jgi:hypothetical protein